VLSIPAFSEEAIALDTVRRCGPDWLYVPDVRQWLHWTGPLWSLDEKQEISSLARESCREFAARAAKDKKTEDLARSLASARTRTAIVSLMSNDPRIVVTSKELDADSLLLGTPAGYVNLETGDLLPADRKHRITMSTAVAPAPRGTPCPLWQGFLESTFPLVPGEPEPDFELIAFKQRLGGYSLTAETKEERFAFLHGAGRNGKGVFTETLLGIMGDYGTVLPAEALMERAVEPHRAELAVLRGKRLVLANEIPSGRRWNQSRLMELTGGGEITANLMRGNPFKFRFAGKLWIVGNNKPIFPAVNVAVADRLMLIRYRMRFLCSDEHSEFREDPAVGRRNNDLKTQLRAEWPAILRWFVDGCLQWQQVGLRIPRQVLEDGDDYLTDQDDLAEWIGNCCLTDLTTLGGAPMMELFASWNLWRAERHQAPTTYPQFRERLKERFLVSRANFGMKATGLFLTDIERARVLRTKEEQRARSNSDGHAGQTWGGYD
jgi:putative DNA primase/helicase